MKQTKYNINSIINEDAGNGHVFMNQYWLNLIKQLIHSLKVTVLKHMRFDFPLAKGVKTLHRMSLSLTQISLSLETSVCVISNVMSSSSQFIFLPM